MLLKRQYCLDVGLPVRLVMSGISKRAGALRWATVVCVCCLKLNRRLVMEDWGFQS